MEDTGQELEPIPLEEVATAFRRFIDSAYGAVLTGSAAPVTSALRARMHEPRVGDWVSEQSTFGMAGRSDLDAVGVLEEIAKEPVQFDPEFVWDEEAEGRPHPVERIYYIRTLDGRRFRWTNARFIAAPHMPYTRL